MPHTVDVLADQLGISIQDLEAATGLSAERVDAILNGRWTPSPEERKKLADAMNYPVDEISWGHTINPRNVRYHRFGHPEPNRDSQ